MDISAKLQNQMREEIIADFGLPRLQQKVIDLITEMRLDEEHYFADAKKLQKELQKPVLVRPRSPTDGSKFASRLRDAL